MQYVNIPYLTYSGIYIKQMKWTISVTHTSCRDVLDELVIICSQKVVIICCQAPKHAYMACNWTKQNPLHYTAPNYTNNIIARMILTRMVLIQQMAVIYKLRH